MSKYGWYIGLIVVGLALMIGGGWVANRQIKTELEPEFVPSESATPSASPKVEEWMVDVSGAVVHPGVYSLKSGARVNEAIKMAGGFAKTVDTVAVSKQLNLAEPIRDGMKVYVPTLADKEDEAPASGAKTEGLISINQAPVEELEELWGVGEARAVKIIENRPYGSVEELVSKAGMPESILEKNQGKISL